MDYPVFFPTLSTLTWDTFLKLRGPWGFYLNHVLCTPTQTFKKLWVTAQVLGFGLDFGLGLVKKGSFKGLKLDKFLGSFTFQRIDALVSYLTFLLLLLHMERF